MEVKINREIRNYTESMFFGLSMRQFIFSILACGVAVGLYFLLRPYFGVETLSWVCILGASPFAMLGFITYHGMTAEQFIWAWLRSEMLEPKEIKFEDGNYYYAALKDVIEGRQTGRPVRKQPKEPKQFYKRKEARVIILDEATAYADPENEYLIQSAISKLVKGKTLIVVAHRLATIQNADQILVVENGKIVGCGRQKELLSKCPLYQRLWRDYVSSADQVEGGF